MSDKVRVRPRVDQAKLSKFKKAFKLKDLTKKAGTISGTMQKSVVKNLDDRIRNGDLQERARIKDLLHFDSKETKGTSKQARVDTRSILATVLGHGIKIEAAEQLRDVLDGVPPEKLTAVLTDLGKEGAFPPGVLIEHLLTSKRGRTPGNNPDPGRGVRNAYAGLKDVLTAFPDDPQRGGKVEVSKNNITVGRDKDGKLKILSQAMTYVPLVIPERNKNLSPEKVEEMKAAFGKVVDANYSRGGVALEMMRAIQQRAMLDHKQPDIGKALDSFKVDGAKIANKYGGGDCMTQADNLVAELGRLGIDAKVVGLMEDKHVQQSKDQNKQIDFDKAAQIAGGMTHTDVVIPYTDQNGVERVLMFVPGMGKPEEGGEPLVFDETADDFMSLDGFRRVIGPDGADLDTSGMQKRQLGFMTNIMITANKPDDEQGKKEMCGLDIVRGKLWLNGNASKKVKPPKELKNKIEGWGENSKGSIEVDLKQMLKNPMEKLKLEVWNDQLKDYEEVEMTKIEALAAGLMAIGKQFGQPQDFVDNILTLGANLDQYREKVIDPEIMEMHK